jgi:hypothetical protein
MRITGIAKFFKTYRFNPLCEWIGLVPFEHSPAGEESTLKVSPPAYLSIPQHTSAYLSIPQHTSAGEESALKVRPAANFCTSKASKLSTFCTSKARSRRSR